MRIELERCTIRLWRAGDEPSLVRNADDRAVWLQLRDLFPHPYTFEHAASWVRFASSQNPALSFAIDVDGEAVGGIGLGLHDDVERVGAELGYWLGRPFWNRGIMTAAVRAFTEQAFARFPLTRIYAVPFATNIASQRVLERAGYVREGVMRRSAIKDGFVLDQVLYAITDLEVRSRAGS